MTGVASDANRTYHERYLAVFKAMMKQDHELALAFNGGQPIQRFHSTRLHLPA